MGIHPYGLFGTNESNNPFGSDYELRRQLATRQAQLSALSEKENLSSDDEKRKSQLTNAVNQLSIRINKAAVNNTTANNTSTQNIKSNNTSTNNQNTNNPNTHYSSADGMVISKSPNKAPSEDYLKGFFLDIKI